MRRQALKINSWGSNVYVKIPVINSKGIFMGKIIKELNKKNFGLIVTEIKKIETYFFAEQYHQQYLASAGSRQYCSAAPTKVKLGDFPGCNYKLKDNIWENFDWEVDKCVLRSNNNPIRNNI